jgi:RNA polymerase sigma-70 factor (ECF subfamily)
MASIVGQTVAEEESAEPHDERSLVESAKHDSAALAELYRQHYSAIAGYVHRRVCDRDEANDIVSDVFLEMVRGIKRYRHRGIPFRIWLYRLASAQLSRWARRRHRWAMKQLGETADNQTRDDLERPLDRETMDIVLSSLPHRLQTAIVLHYVEGMSVADVARVTESPTGTVKSRLSEGRSLMRERLNKRGFRNENK